MTDAAQQGGTWLAIERLRANPRNYRGHPEAQLAALRNNLRRHGQQKPVVIDGDDTIIAGHGIVEAARQLGWQQVWVHIYSGSDAAAFLLDDNESVRLAQDDNQMLAGLLRERLEAGSLDSSGWAEDEVRVLLERIEAEHHQLQGEDPGPGAVPAEPVTRPGDCWLLGDNNHRLLCGDCTDAVVIERLFGGQPLAACCVTSPPYAMQRAATYGGIPATHYPAWLLRVAAQVWRVLAPTGSLFVNIKAHVEEGERSLYVMKTVLAMKAARWRYVDELIWVKPGLPGDFQGRLRNDFEPIHHFAKAPEIAFRPRAVGHTSDQVRQYIGGAQHGASGNITVEGPLGYGIARPGNVQHFGTNRESLDHPAMFPVALPAFFMRLTTDEGECVFEPFSGAGTTIIAAQQNGRRCFATEMQPAYCDVAIERWQTMTGQQARHMEEGFSFADARLLRLRNGGQVARSGAIQENEGAS